jgi:hypothetical protein
MTESQIKVDALLATASSRMLCAASASNRLREALRSGDDQATVQSSLSLAEHLAVIEAAMLEVARLVEIQRADMLGTGFIVLQKNDGRIH